MGKDVWLELHIARVQNATANADTHNALLRQECTSMSVEHRLKWLRLFP